MSKYGQPEKVMFTIKQKANYHHAIYNHTGHLVVDVHGGSQMAQDILDLLNTRDDRHEMEELASDCLQIGIYKNAKKQA